MVALSLVLLLGEAWMNPTRWTAAEMSILAVALLMLAATAVALWFRWPSNVWARRRVSRDTDDSQQALAALIDALRETRSMTDVAELISTRVEAALQARRVLVLYREPFGDALTLSDSTNRASGNTRLPADSALIRTLERDGKPLDARIFARGLTEKDGRWLSEVGAELVVPIGGGRHNLVGLLLVSGKKSDQPYTQADRRLLETLAASARTVVEHTTVRDSKTTEAREGGVIERTSDGTVVPLRECPLCGRCYEGTEDMCARDGSALRRSAPVERTIDGKYRLERLVGRGGMGTVYEATDLRLGRSVAVKVMTDNLFGPREALRRFEREARTAASLRHRNVVAIYDYGQIGAGGAYFVMEMLHGATLRQELRARGALSPREAADLFDQVLDAMRAAHGQGIVHRDLKPENVFLARESNGDRVVKVLDFGLAKVRRSGDPTSLTVPGTVMGTIGYSSPEQLAGRAVDHRTDLFALGLMVVEAITGTHPFMAADFARVATAIAHQPFRLPGDSPRIRALDDALQKCLAKDADQRLGSAAELQRMLVPALRRCPSLVVALPTPSEVGGRTASRWQSSGLRRRLGRWR